MRHLYCKDEKSWVEAANRWLIDQKDEFKARTVYLPAGETPRALYKNWQKESPAFLKDLTFVQIDDVVSGRKKDMFKQFFYDELPQLKNQFEFFGPGDTVADLAILGLGLNGHVAFHEPGLDANFFSGCVQLSAKTKETLELEPETWGQTFGINAFLRAKSILMLVRGEKKRDVSNRLMRGDLSLPAAHLLKHNNFTLLTDFEIEQHEL